MKDNLTGYPHIDMPWMKFYDKQFNLDIPNMNILDYIALKNKDRLDSVAEIYYGKKYRYKDLIKGSNAASSVLSQVGVKKGDIIGSLISNIPEAGLLWFGATDIGAITDFIDPRPDIMNGKVNFNKILKVFKDEGVKHIISLDMSYVSMLKPIENELKDIGIETIIIVSSNDSLTREGRVDYIRDIIEYNKLANSRKNKEERVANYKVLRSRLQMERNLSMVIEDSLKTSPIKIYRYKDLLLECEKAKYDKVSDANLVNYIGHTSGTTRGMPKPVVHTNKGGIALCEQCEFASFTPERGTKAFHLLPFFAPAGAYSNYLNQLASGVETIDISEFYIGDFGYLIKKYKPNSLLATPTWLTLLPNCSYLKKEDLSYLQKIIYVGEAMSPQDKVNLQKWISSAKLENAHGMSEIGGCGAYAKASFAKDDSIGIPLPGTIYAIVDPNIEDELVPVRFNDNDEYIEGELCISALNVTPGILNGKTIVPKYELDGKYYIRTKDLVKMDREGRFYFSDRKDRAFCRVDGFKIKPYEIENVVRKNPYVKDVRIVKYYDSVKNGNMPRCCIILKEEYQDISHKDIVEDIVYHTIMTNSYMSLRHIPSKFSFFEFYPITKNNKIDYRKLGDEDSGNDIFVDIDETNLSVGNIKIYENTKNKMKVIS